MVSSFEVESAADKELVGGGDAVFNVGDLPVERGEMIGGMLGNSEDAT